jgi:serine/threonine protein kinase
MDYCPGGDLANLLNIHSNLPENVVKIYVAEITLALEALHE